MHVVRHTTAREFLAATEGFRAAHPVLTNIIGSVAERVRAGQRYDSELWLTSMPNLVASLPGSPCGPPRTTSSSPRCHRMPRGLSGATWLRSIPNLPGVTGERDVCQALLEGFEPLTERTSP